MTQSLQIHPDKNHYRWLLWHWSFSSISSWQKGLGMLGFLIFLWMAMVELILGRAPRIRIDPDGVVAFQTLFWRRRARWADIAKCEISTITNFLGQGPTRIFNFQSATGKSLLQLLPALFRGALEGLSENEQAEIEQEIKRRLGHEIHNESASEPKSPHS